MYDLIYSFDVVNMDTMDTGICLKKGSLLGEHHKVIDILGEGTYGVVTKCLNTVSQKMEAIKVIKSHPSLYAQAMDEIAILTKLQCLDPDTCHIIKYNGDFFADGNICLNFELLDQDLFDFLHSRNKGLLMSEIRPVILQLATALFHLRSIGIIHGDLKPDNVMVVDRSQHPLQVKLIDFGLAYPVDDWFNIFQTIWYRSPEVILGMPFDEAVDMWSLGLLVVEMIIQRPVYPGQSNHEMLMLIMQKQGQLSDDLLDRGPKTDDYFIKQSNGPQRWRFMAPELTNKIPQSRIKLDEVSRLVDGTESDRHLLQDLIMKMLEPDPDKRITPLEVLQHPFFTPDVPQSPTANTCMEMDASIETPDVILPTPCWIGDQQAPPKNGVAGIVANTNNNVNDFSQEKEELSLQQGRIPGEHHKVSAVTQVGTLRDKMSVIDKQSTEAITVSEKDPEIDTDKETQEIYLHSSCEIGDDPAGQDNNHESADNTATFLAAGLENTGGVHSKKSTKNSSYLARCFRRVFSYFSGVRNQHSTWFQAVDPEDIDSRIENVFVHRTAKDAGAIHPKKITHQVGPLSRFVRKIKKFNPVVRMQNRCHPQ